MNNGYVYVASLSEPYYKAAIMSADSLKDYYPDAKITLFTHPEFFQERDRKLFENVYLDIPYHTRAKMHGISRTPYKNTLYLDADTEIRSDRIKDVFQILGNNDIMFTKILPHVSKDTSIDKDNKLEYHGGIVLYNNKKHTIQLMKDWYDLYDYQRATPWNESKFKEYNIGMRPWDQFTMWYLLHKEKKHKKVKHAFFPDGGTEYNYISLLDSKLMPENKKYQDLEQVIYHYTIPRESIDAGYIKDKSGAPKYS